MQQPNTNSIVAQKQSIRNALNGPSSSRNAVEPQEDEDIGFTVSEGDDDDDDAHNLSDSSTHSNAIVLSDHEDELDLKSIYDLDVDLDVDLDLDSDVDLDAHDDLARVLEEDAHDDFDHLDADELDDSLIEQEEERAIQEQYTSKPVTSNTKRRRSSESEKAHSRPRDPTPTPAYTHSDDEAEPVTDFNELSGVGLGLGLDDEAVESSSDAFSEGSAWGNDLFDENLNLNAPKRAVPLQKQTSSFLDEEDDTDGDESYLWQYFFSSGDTDNDSDIFDAGTAEKSNSSDENVKPTRPVQATHLPSGESTDEDDGVPPERKRRRAKGTKALEVLGSNSYTTRPPLLGTWEIDGDKNIGIIDGRTTRTLSPPPFDEDSNGTDGTDKIEDEVIEARPHKSRQSSRISEKSVDGLSDFDDDTFFELPESLDVNDFENDDMSVFIEDHDHPQPEQHPPLKRSGSNLDIGDFINMSSDSEDQIHLPDNDEALSKQSPAISPYLYRGRLQSRNNASAFNALRNRGSPFVSNLAYYSDDMSPAIKRRRRPRSAINGNVHTSPMKRRKRRSFQGVEPVPEERDQDFIGELIEIGAISPIFDVNT